MSETSVPTSYAPCLTYGTGVLLPMSDYGGPSGQDRAAVAVASVVYKAWVCTNAACGFNIVIKNGTPSYGKPLAPPRGASPRQDPLPDRPAAGQAPQRSR